MAVDRKVREAAEFFEDSHLVAEASNFGWVLLRHANDEVCQHSVRPVLCRGSIPDSLLHEVRRLRDHLLRGGRCTFVRRVNCLTVLDDGFLWITRRIIVAHEVLNPVFTDSINLIGEIPRHGLRVLLRRPHGIDAVLLVDRLRGELSDVAEEVLRPRPLHLRLVWRPRIIAVD